MHIFIARDLSSCLSFIPKIGMSNGKALSVYDILFEYF